MEKGFKYQEVENIEIEIAEQYEPLSDGNCIYCGTTTTLYFELENGLNAFIPVCKKHIGKLRAKENSIKSILETLKTVIVA